VKSGQVTEKNPESPRIPFLLKIGFFACSTIIGADALRSSFKPREALTYGRDRHVYSTIRPLTPKSITRFGMLMDEAVYHELARIVEMGSWPASNIPERDHAAGTSRPPVAEEAAVTA